MTAVKVTDPAHGTLTLNTDGTFFYSPNNGYIGDDTFTYKANDGGDESNIATVTIQIRPVIDVGNHVLQPDTAGQKIDIFVSGGIPIQGMAFNAQIGDGGPIAGGTAAVTFQAVDLVGTAQEPKIFTGNNNG